MIIRSARVVLPDGVRGASIHIENGRIAAIVDRDADREREVSTEPVLDVGGLVVSPGIVDSHVHINEPGRTDWEGFDSGTRAAAAGGITTIVDMPLNSIPPTTTVAALEAKRAAAGASAHVDVAFWGGVVPGNAGDLDTLNGLVDAGVRGFKCFLAPSGVDEFHHVGEADLRQAMPVLTRRGVPLLVHAESPTVLTSVARTFQLRGCPEDSTLRYADYASTRPPRAEVVAIELMVRLAREFGTRVHIVHVASAEALDVIARAKADGVSMTAETCPHYLTFTAQEIPDGATEFKCAPPIREARHREALWWGLARGTLDLVATDHSPAPPSMKPRGGFMRAWGGIASLEASLAACNAGLLGPQSNCEPAKAARLLANWLSAAPARLAGLHARKGAIAPGFDADLVIWDQQAEVRIDPERLQQRHKLTPYAGRCLRGVVHTTIVRGERVWDGGRLVAERRGQLL